VSEPLHLIVSWATGLALFTLTMLVYGVGIVSGWATFSPQLIVAVAMQSVAISLVLFAFWD
jgi:fatty acid desaturase